MVETGAVVGLADVATQQSQQSLPTPQQQDVSRFQDLMTGKQDVSTAIQPQPVNSSNVLQFVEPGQQATESSGLVDNLINQATRIDSTYHTLMEQMANRPNIDDYFASESGTGGSQSMLTYPNVAVDTGSGSGNEMEGIMSSFQDNSKASLAYQRDLNDWAMGFRMWSSGVEIISSAASKVSQGFQTLFRASG